MKANFAFGMVVVPGVVSWALALSFLPACAPDAPDWQDADADERICRDTARDIFGTDYEIERRKYMAELYLRCIEQRRERQASTREALEADYLERLQGCNERAQEAYDLWAACVYAGDIERESNAGCSVGLPAEAPDTKRGDQHASDVQGVRGEGAAAGGR